jgi:hypothetical protein
MSCWFKIDANGIRVGHLDGRRAIISGEPPEQLASYAISNISDCFVREIGRPPTRLELELVWRRTLDSEVPMPVFQRCPESEVL